MINKSAFYALCEEIFSLNGLDDYTAPAMLDCFVALADHIMTVNEHLNLTAITDEREFAVRHFADSLTAAKWLPIGAQIIDVGCGAGLPALPLAIIRPDLKITALDATAKRIAFVADAAARLGLSNLTSLAARAEDAARGELRESFDCAISRAVARLDVLSELCLPFVRTGGRFIAMKGEAGSEIAEAEHAIRTLGGELSETTVFSLLGEAEPQARTIVCISKTSPTPREYPRDFAKIKKRPL